MADKEIGDLTAAAPLDGTETLHVVQSGNSRKATASRMAGVSPRRAVALSGTPFDPTTATWGEVGRVRPTKFPLPADAWYHDSFETDRSYTESLVGGASSATKVVEHGTYKVRRNAGPFGGMLVSKIEPPIECFSIIAEVSGYTITGGYGMARVGVATDADNCIFARFNVVNKAWAIIGRNAGTDTAIASGMYSGTTPTKFKLGLQFMDQNFHLLMDTGGGLFALGSGSYGSFTDAQVADMKFSFGADLANVAGEEFVFADLIAGQPSPFGYRDQALLTYEDGTPIERSGKFYLLGSFASPTTGGYTGVAEYDPRSKSLLPTGVMVFHDATDGQEFRTGACGVFDRNAGLSRIFVSGFASAVGATKGVTMYTTDELPLSGPVYLSGGQSLSLPLGANGATHAYDPAVIWDGTEWIVAYTLGDGAGNHWPAVSTSSDLVTFSFVAEDYTVAAAVYEGTKITKMNGAIRIFSSGFTTVRVYDESLVLQGTITGLKDTSSIASPPQFLPIPVRDWQGYTQWQAIQFNVIKAKSGANFTWGDWCIYQAVEKQQGFEFQPVTPPF